MPATSVHLVDYPVRLGARQQEHLDELTREFMLLALSRPEGREQVPERLLQLVEALTAHSSHELEAPRRVREQALLDGVEHVELVYPALEGMREAMTGWQAMLREVDEYCRSDDLLALATPDDVVELQKWVVQEFLHQLDGGAPTSWRSR